MTIQNRWPADLLERARKLWLDDGLSAGQVAKALGGGLSRSAIIGKARRCGWTRPQDIGRQNQTASGKARRAPRDPAGLPTFKTWNGNVIDAAPPIPLPAAAPDLTATKSLVELGFGDCRWPIGEPRDADFGFCGRHAEGTYCKAHAARAHSTNGRGVFAADPKELGRLVRRYA